MPPASRHTPRLGLLGVVLAQAGAFDAEVSYGTEDPRELATEWGHEGGTARRWAPPLAAGSGMELVTMVYRDKPCILHRGNGFQGGMCFQSGWAVEAEFTAAVDSVLVTGMTIPDATHVRFGRSREALTVPVVDVPGRVTERYFAFTLPPEGLKVRPNDIVALDERGRLLGRQHYNDGHDRFGAYDGLYDRRFK